MQCLLNSQFLHDCIVRYSSATIASEQLLSNILQELKFRITSFHNVVVSYESKSIEDKYLTFVNSIFLGRFPHHHQFILKSNSSPMSYSASVFQCINPVCSKLEFCCLDNLEETKPQTLRSWLFDDRRRKSIESWKVCALKPLNAKTMNTSLQMPLIQRNQYESLDWQAKVKKLKTWVEMYSKITVICGAGISTTSNIPDFRGPHGLLKNPVDNEVLSTRMMEATPSLSHYIIQFLLKEHVIDYAITQNIDGLFRSHKLPPAYYNDNSITPSLLEQLVKDTKFHLQRQLLLPKPGAMNLKKDRFKYPHYNIFDGSVTTEQLEQLFTHNKMVAPAQPYNAKSFNKTCKSNHIARFRKFPIETPNILNRELLVLAKTLLEKEQYVWISSHTLEQVFDLNLPDNLDHWNITDRVTNMSNVLHNEKHGDNDKDLENMQQKQVFYFIGSQGTQTAHHIDGTPALSRIVNWKGKKLWLFFSITEALKKLPGFKYKQSQQEISVKEIMELDYKWCFQTKNEFIYFSADIAHMVFNLENSVSQSFSFMHGSALLSHLKFLQSENIKNYFIPSAISIRTACKIAQSNLVALQNDCDTLHQSGILPRLILEELREFADNLSRKSNRQQILLEEFEASFDNTGIIIQGSPTSSENNNKNLSSISNNSYSTDDSGSETNRLSLPVLIDELHGCIYEAVCPKCSTVKQFTKDVRKNKHFRISLENKLNKEELADDHEATVYCEECCCTMRDTVVLTGSEINSIIMERARKEFQFSDLCLVIGTSLFMHESFELANKAEQVVVINIGASKIDNEEKTALTINKLSDEVLRLLVIELGLQEKFNAFCSAFKL